MGIRPHSSTARASALVAALLLSTPMGGGAVRAQVVPEAAPQAEDTEVAPAFEQAPEPSEAPAASGPEAAALTHMVVTVGMGVPVRVGQEDDFGQSTFAPVFLDGLAAVAFPVGGPVQHGLGLGLSIGMSEDGGFYEPTPAGSQLALMPAYVAYLAMHPDLITMAHLGVPILLSGGTSVGFDVAATLGYRMLAGFGLYAELSFGGFAGARSSLNLTAGLEAGLFIDYEVLP